MSDTGARKMPPAPGTYDRELGSPRESRAPRRGLIVMSLPSATVAVVTVAILVLVPAVTPEKIPIGE